jgi:putative protease
VLNELSGGILSYFGIVFVPLFEYQDYSRKANGVYIPPVVTESELNEVRVELEKAKANGAEYALVSNIGALKLARDAELYPIADFRLNVMNSYARDALSAIGIPDSILSPELTDKQSAAIGGRAVVYGRIPLMLTERCFISENFGCDRCDRASITDRRGIAFPIIREWKHRNLILNSKPTYTADILGKYRRAESFSEHYLFSIETAKEISDVIRSYQNEMRCKGDYRRMGRRDFERE